MTSLPNIDRLFRQAARAMPAAPRRRPLPSVAALLPLLTHNSSDAVGDARLLRQALEAETYDGVAAVAAGPVRCPKTWATLPRYASPRYGAAYWQLRIADELMGGHGVECAGPVHLTLGPVLEYVNVGDTYALTLCRLCNRDGRHTWRVTTVGDIIENDRRFRGR